MEVVRKNYKEDLKLLIYLGEEYNGERFSIAFSSGQYGVKEYVCTYDGETYTNCEKADDTHVLCMLDSHGLPVGLVSAEITILLPDSQMSDGNYKLHTKGLLEFECEGQKCHLELYKGKSDAIAIPEAAIVIIGNIIKGEKGEKGDPFRYEDFTPEELADLKGERGADGRDGRDGQDGYTPQKGVDYFDGKDGKDGRDGIDGGIIYPKFTLDPHTMHLYIKDGAHRIRVDERGHLRIRINNA